MARARAWPTIAELRAVSPVFDDAYRAAQIAAVDVDELVVGWLAGRTVDALTATDVDGLVALLDAAYPDARSAQVVRLGAWRTR